MQDTPDTPSVVDTWEEGRYSVANFSAGLGWLQGAPQWWGYSERLQLGKITVMGVEQTVSSLLVNGQPSSFAYQQDNKVGCLPILALLANMKIDGFLF